MQGCADGHYFTLTYIVKPWSKSESLSQQTPS